VKSVSKIIARVVIHLLIVAQLVLIFNDFPSTENTAKVFVSAKATKVKFISIESELTDGEEDKVDFCPQDLLIHSSNGLHLIFASQAQIQQRTNGNIFLAKKNIYLVNRTLLI
jgi:hypothetical protein